VEEEEEKKLRGARESIAPGRWTRRSVRAELRPRFGRSGARWARLANLFYYQHVVFVRCHELGDVVFIFFDRILLWCLFMEKSH
jgi:hypothetical protein